jgi:hypothetical protein
LNNQILVPTEKSVRVDTFYFPGSWGIRSPDIMSVFLAVLQLEVLALRHQLQVLQRTRPRRIRLDKADRWLWMSLSRVWTEWRW